MADENATHRREQYLAAQDPKCPRCGRRPTEKCIEDGPGLRVNTRMCPRKRVVKRG